MTLPFENDTGRVIKRLAKRSLAADKRRNLFVILTISLAVCLMAAVAFIFTARQHRTLEFIRGQYQSGCINMSYEDIDRLVNAGKFEKWGYEAGGDTIRYKDTNVTVKFIDPGMIELMRYEPITGTYPQTENEICVERAFLDYIELPAEVGQIITLDVGYGEQAYTVSGIMEKENTSRLFDTFISEAAIVTHGGGNPFDLRFRFADSQAEQPEQLRADIAAFYKEMGIREGDTFYSSNYFDTTSLYLGSDMSVYAVALLIAVACSVVIYSIFYISVMGKMREYGRLKAIGATPKQLARVVKRERRLLAAIAIPIGLVSAALISAVLVPGHWVWGSNLKYAVIIVVITYIIVLLSTRKPLKLVGKVSAIEAVRTTAYSSQQSRAVSKQLHRQLTMQRLAAMNFSRNRKKAVMTLVSLGLTGIMAISVAAYANSVDTMEMAKAGFGDRSDYLVGSDSAIGQEFMNIQMGNPLGENMRNTLENIPNVDYITSYSATSVEIDVPKSQDPFFVRGLTREQMGALLPESVFQEGSADYDSLLENNGILVAKDLENLLYKLYGADFAVGDSIMVKCFNGNSKTYTVMGIVDMVSVVSASHFFILPEEELHMLYPEISDFTTYINIHAAEDGKQLRQDIFDTVADPKLYISSVNDYARQLEGSMRQLIIILYGLLFFIFLFALLNLINTLATNLLSRQREFGVFQSVGMSNRQLSAMLSYECLLYVGATMLITLTIGSGCSVVLCKVFDQIGIFGKIIYHFPVVQVLIFAAALLLVQAIFSIIAVWYFKKLTLVERIKTMD